jgi:hypothetical protein
MGVNIMYNTTGADNYGFDTKLKLNNVIITGNLPLMGH